MWAVMGSVDQVGVTVNALGERLDKLEAANHPPKAVDAASDVSERALAILRVLVAGGIIGDGTRVHVDQYREVCNFLKKLDSESRSVK